MINALVPDKSVLCVAVSVDILGPFDIIKFKS